VPNEASKRPLATCKVPNRSIYPQTSASNALGCHVLTSRLTRRTSASIVCSHCPPCSMTVHWLASVMHRDPPANTARSSVDSVHANRMSLEGNVRVVKLDIMDSLTVNVRNHRKYFHVIVIASSTFCITWRIKAY